MRRRMLLVGSLAVLVAFGPSAVNGLEPFEAASDGRLRVEWEAASRKSVPIIRGYVINDHAIAAANVRLMVEVLDASGAVVGKRVGWVLGTVPNSNRTYFELKVPAAAGYRVRVLAWDWFNNPESGRRIPASRSVEPAARVQQLPDHVVDGPGDLAARRAPGTGHGALGLPHDGNDRATLFPERHHPLHGQAQRANAVSPREWQPEAAQRGGPDRPHRDRHADPIGSAVLDGHGRIRCAEGMDETSGQVVGRHPVERVNDVDAETHVMQSRQSARFGRDSHRRGHGGQHAQEGRRKRPGPLPKPSHDEAPIVAFHFTPPSTRGPFRATMAPSRKEDR